MHRYFIKTPWIVKAMFPSYVWNLPADDNAVYITFDDGPHPRITPWVLDQLKEYDAQASFFCVGNNVQQYPEVYGQVLENGHAVGNHTYHHLNGWKTAEENYLDDIKKAAEFIRTNLFRPPYGRIRQSQARKLSNCLHTSDSRIIMWDVLSADFDSSVSPQRCLANVVENVVAGSIVVFHDSEKAYPNLKQTLPGILKYLKEAGYSLRKIDL
ncbi:MAG: polysaccharide deacetylase family protein [Flavisolibacter sp.]